MNDDDTNDGASTDRDYRTDCPICQDGGRVRQIPEAGYATCVQCGERGYWREDGTEWWRYDPDSMWYVGRERDAA